MTPLAAVHEFRFWPSRHFAAAQQFGRIWSEADINHRAGFMSTRQPLASVSLRHQTGCNPISQPASSASEHQIINARLVRHRISHRRLRM
jgi:hypothetical protein